jgi:ParB family chromosome partitioning protein
MSQRESTLLVCHERTLGGGADRCKDTAVVSCLAPGLSVTSEHMAKSGLGKGLGALIGTRPPMTRPDNDAVGQAEKIRTVALSTITPSPLQPRKEFERDALQELVDSIRQHGIIQPLVVRPIDGRHELIAGERRWRAAQEAGLTEVPVIVRHATDLEVLELSLIENLQRQDLNPIEEANGYARLAREFGMRQEDIAAKVGRSRAAVANAMRLLELDRQIQIWLTQDLLSVGHAKVLLALKSAEEQLLVAETVLRRKSTVRATERLVARQLGITRSRRKSRGTNGNTSGAVIDDLQERLQQHLGTHVKIQHSEKGGRIEIDYYGDEDLERILSLLGLTQSQG